MEWREQGALIAVRRHGESAAIIEVFTESRGRHAGVVRGGAGRRLTPVLQPGAQLDLTWRARLEDHLGHFTVEPLRSRAPGMFASKGALLALGSVCALLRFTLPEREPYPALYRRTLALLDTLEAGGDSWMGDYLRWEMALLDAAGFGLDLSRCAATGTREGLRFVSPRSGCAVSAAGAGNWSHRLLPLPPCLLGDGPAPAAEVLEGLRTTGHFLHRRLAPALGERPLPSARARLVDALTRHQVG